MENNLKNFSKEFEMIRCLDEVVATPVRIYKDDNYIAEGVINIDGKQKYLELPVRLKIGQLENVNLKMKSGRSFTTSLEVYERQMKHKSGKVEVKTFCSFPYLKNADFSSEYVSRFQCFLPTESSELKTFRFQLETMPYTLPDKICMYQCVRIQERDYQFDILQVKHGERGYYVIDSFQRMTFKDFGDYCFAIQQTIGFVTGYMPGGEIFYFSEQGEFYYTNRIRPALKTMYIPISINPYCFEQLWGSVAETYQKKLKILSAKEFSNLVDLIYSNKRFSATLMMMIESESMCSLLLMPGIYAIVLESLARILVIPVASEKRPIGNKKLFQKISAGIEKVIDSYASDLGAEDDLQKLKSRIPELNKTIRQSHLTNSEKLVQPFEQLGIVLTAGDREILAHRNDLLHGNMLLTNIEELSEGNINNYIQYASGKFYTLISSLILKYIGYSGYLINYAKFYEKQCGIETNEDFYRLI